MNLMKEITSLSQLDMDSYYTYQDYMTWKFQERLELFKGRIFKMSPTPNVAHQRISRILMRLFDQFLLDKKFHLFSAPFDVRLPISLKMGL